MRISNDDTSGGWHWLSGVALAIVGAVVIARLTMLEILREPLPATLGAPPVPAGPGATAGLALDLITGFAGVLVLIRRRLDASFTLRWSWPAAFMGLLAVWAAISTAWTGDKFAAAVSASHFISAAITFWIGLQVAREWIHLRMVGAFAFGLLLVLAAQGYYYQFVERPGVEQDWQQNRAEYLRTRGLQPGSFEAQQLENRVLHGELMGFSASPNTYAAMLVLLGFASAGTALQREIDGSPIAAGFIEVCIAAGLPILYWTQSRTAYATPVLGIAALGGVALSRKWLAQNARLAFAIGAAGVALVAAAIIAHGLHHGTLFHSSLTFRWRYWVGSWPLFRRNAWVGVGWENFGSRYLATRLPTATEEIKDPHNFIVRFFVELGLVGGALALAWIVSLAWAITRPRWPGGEADDVSGRAGGPSTISLPSPWALTATGLAGFCLNVAAGLDLSQDFNFVLIELFRRLVFLGLLLGGIAAAILRTSHPGTMAATQVSLDDRPAPWILYALIVGLGLFLLHNTIDFSLFEPGAMSAFCIVAGTVLGTRRPAQRRTERWGNRRTTVAVVAAGIAWLAASAFFVLPVALAEDSARDGEQYLRRREPAEAARAFEAAHIRLPINADYAYRAFVAWRFAGDTEGRAPVMLDAAIAADPYQAGYNVGRAESELERRSLDGGRVRSAFERALALDPANVANRLRYAEVLERLGTTAEAEAQYTRALWYDAQLTPEEHKRLAADKVTAVRLRMEALTRPASLPAAPR